MWSAVPDTPPGGDGPGSAPRRGVSRGGRRRDPGRDVAILEATLEVLAREGFDGMTISMVATRARAGRATLYRRWTSKADLALDAVAHMQRTAVALDRLPNTGTLRGDLAALSRPRGLREQGYRLRIVTALMSISTRDPRLAEAAHLAVTGAWVEVNRQLIRRAVDRGEFPAGAPVSALSRLIPMMAASRACLQQQPITRDFIVDLIDGVLIPALRGSAPPWPGPTPIPTPGSDRG